MDNVGIVVEDIDAAIEFFTELGLELEGRAPIEGDWADGVTGLRDMRVEIAMMRTPDGHSRLEMSRFLAPPVVADHRSAPVNALGYLRVMFTVEDIDDTLARLGKRGAELVGEVVQYEDMYRLCYIRPPGPLWVSQSPGPAPPYNRTEPKRNEGEGCLPPTPGFFFLVGRDKPPIAGPPHQKNPHPIGPGIAPPVRQPPPSLAALAAN